jgi:hypothetical protein
MWYLSMSKLEDDEEAQKRGLVFVRYSVGVSNSQKVKMNLDYIVKSSFLPKALPLKASGYHFCYDNEILRSILGPIQMIMGQKYRIRFRAHCGKSLLWESFFQVHRFFCFH